MKQDLSASQGPPHQGLPIELWIEILNLAAHIPRELGIAEWTGDYDRLELGRRGLHQLTARTYLLKSGLKIRLRLSLVCRLWNKLIRKWLYQSIVIDNKDRLRSFHRLLKKSPENAALVKRLDISYENMFINNSNSIGSIFSKFQPKWPTLFLEVLERCSNLLLVADCSTFACSHLIFYQSKNHGINLYTTPLQQLMFTRHTLSVDQISEGHFQHIRALQLPQITTDFSEVRPALSFLKLEVFDISPLSFLTPEIDDWLSSWDLPCLHSLTISIVDFTDLINDRLYKKFSSFWKKFSPQICTLCIQDRSSNETRYSENSHPFLSIAEYRQPLNMQNLEQLIVPIWILEEILSTFAANTIRAIGVFWNYFPNLDSMFPPEAFVLRLVSQPAVFNLFPNLKSFYITCIPNLYPSPGNGDTYRSIYEERRISDLVGYLDAYEDSIRDQGISIGLTMTNGGDIESTVELRRIYYQFLTVREGSVRPDQVPTIE